MGAAAAAANIRAEGARRNHNVYDGDDCCQDMVRQLGVPKRWPPGVRFHPTDEELVLFYLKRKVCRRQIKPSMIGEVDVYKWEPWDLPEKSVVRKGEKQWFFFSPRDRKYPNGSRSNRATKHGYWKATGKDRSIYHKSKTAGNKKTLVYYRGRAPKGERTDWVMHEYTIDEFLLENFSNVQDSYALYKLFMKSGPGPKNGEQYGAPFREEDWEDDIAEDSYMDQNDGEDISSANLTRSSDPISCNEEFCATFPVSDVENLLMQLAYEPDIFQEHPNNSAYTSKVDVEPEIRSNIIDPSFLDTDSILIGGETWFENGMERRFQNLQTVVAYSQPTELPDIVSEQHIVTADEEFLELKDLNDPDLSCSLDDISNRILTFEPEEFYDPYDYFDANMYLLESMGLQYDEEPQNHAVPVSNELWTHEETFNSSTVPDTNEVLAIPPESGFDNPSHFLSTTQMHANEDTNTAESPSQSWFNSALSAFLDSVPSSPAFASEKVLISKAFERVSSFRTAQIRPRQRDAAASGAQRNRGYLFISVLVGFGAVLWVLTIGAAFKLLKGFWGRFLSA